MRIIYVSEDMYDAEKNELKDGGILLSAEIEKNEIRKLKRLSLNDPDDDDEPSTPEQQDKLGREVAREIMGLPPERGNDD